jgi:GntR family transcriptional repressor for pyruvate dehydrogenase complex
LCIKKRGAQVVREKLQKVNQIRTFEHASDQIRTLIKNRQILPGEKLPTEQELCEALNIGRSSIREALRVLEAEGLIEVRRGSGAYITSNTTKILTSVEALDWLKPRGESLIQILEVREHIERLTVSLVTRAHSKDLILDLNAILDQLIELGKQKKSKIDLNEVTNLNTQFHLSISKASGNDIAHEILMHLLPAFSKSNKLILLMQLPLDRQISEHREIITSIQKGDPDRAEQVIEKHIKRILEEIQRIED